MNPKKLPHTQGRSSWRRVRLEAFQIKRRNMFLVWPLVFFLSFFSLEWNGLTLSPQKVAAAAVVVLDDDASQLAGSGWSVTSASSGTYITDHTGTLPNPNGVMMKPVPEGQYLIYGDEVAAAANKYTFMTKVFPIGAGPWLLEFDARIDDLIEVNEAPTLGIIRGLSFEVKAAGKTVKVTLQRDKVLVKSSSILVADYEHLIPDDGLFHRWGIAYDGSGKMLLSIDEMRIVSFNIAPPVSSGADSLKIINTSMNSVSGHNEVYLDHLKMTVGELPQWAQVEPRIKALSASPYSDSQEVVLGGGVDDIPPNWLSGGELEIRTKLIQDDQIIAQISQILSSTRFQIALAPGGQSGIMTAKAELYYKSRKVNELTSDFYVYSSVHKVNPGDALVSVPGSVYMYDDMIWLEDSQGLKAPYAGWKTGKYHDLGSNEDELWIANEPGAHSLELPLELQGRYAVYVGYVAKAGGFQVSYGEEASGQVEGISTVTGTTYGLKAIEEQFLFAGQFAGERIRITPLPGQQAFITYFKLRSLTAEELTLYDSQSEGAAGKRTIYNNDGFSNFFQGFFPTTSKLEEKGVEIYAGKDVGQIDWQLLATFTLNHNSLYAGVPFAGSEAYESQMRDGDKLARQQITAINASGRSPLQIVAEKADQLGLKTNASLRMNAVYDPATNGYLNGAVYYNQMLPYRIADKNGTVNFRVDYGNLAVREYMKNVLLEAAAFPGVDGINLDFGRYPNLFGYKSELTDAYLLQYGIEPKNETSAAGLERWDRYKAEVITQMLRELQQALPTKQITVRFPYDGYKQYGLDIDAWIAEEVVDMIIPTTLSHEQFFDITPFVEAVGDSAVQLYIGTTHSLSGHDLTKAEEDLIKQGIPVNRASTVMSELQYRLRAYDAYQAGADGIYVFNNWSGNNSLNKIGDKIDIEKWHHFAYPADLVTNLIEAEAPVPGANSKPLTRNLTVATLLNTAVGGTLRAVDADGDELTYSLVANGQKGTASVTDSAYGTFSYLPNLGQTGLDTVTFRVYDGHEYSLPATITVTIEPVHVNGMLLSVGHFAAENEIQSSFAVNLKYRLDLIQLLLNQGAEQQAVAYMEDFNRYIKDPSVRALNLLSTTAAQVLEQQANAFILALNTIR
ncbi:FIMAH domain-containing protein [Paenibacillus ginsengarvi]|uniref:FIMAH domain-containing protein n=1 Tax=Paenibacillus ginsengarvi TaxID=400777 RepID=UPI0013154F20|nr:Ig-like domain-containing protein [Paenibacillus ginsengarvi]